MLIQFFVGMLNLSLPPLLAYAIFLWIKAAKPIARSIYIKILACGIPVLVLIHFMIMVSAGQLLLNKDQRHARNGIYINRELGDTVKLADDSLCILYNPKDSLKRIESKYDYLLNEKTIFEPGPGQPSIAVSLKYLLNRKPVTGDVTAQLPWIPQRIQNQDIIIYYTTG